MQMYAMVYGIICIYVSYVIDIRLYGLRLRWCIIDLCIITAMNQLLQVVRYNILYLEMGFE